MMRRVREKGSIVRDGSGVREGEGVFAWVVGDRITMGRGQLGGRAMALMAAKVESLMMVEIQDFMSLLEETYAFPLSLSASEPILPILEP